MAMQADARSITPSLPRALPNAARVKVENAIEAHLSAVAALTAFLDEADGDQDLEPSLGISQDGSWDDREMDVGDEGEAGSDDDLSCEDLSPGNFQPEAM